VTRIVENTSTKVHFIVPDTGHLENRLEIRTQFTGGSAILKTPHVITSPFILEQV
jgi:hypothetical protein